MQKIRVANAHYLSAVPFRLLKDIPSVAYEENSAAENARRLAEHAVDVALIPVSDYARHGGYVGLDFGIACARESNCIFLYSNDPIEELDTIYLYNGAGTSALLLSLLLHEHWKIIPRLVRRSGTFLDLPLGPKEGVLARHETHTEVSNEFRYSEDLVRVWHDITGKHFVFMVWAVRPGVLNSKTYTEFNEMFHKCSKAKTLLAGEHASSFDVSVEVSSDFVSANNEYYLDVDMVNGLNAFFALASRANLVPKIKYRSATRSLLNHGPKYLYSLKSNTIEALGHSLDGERLGVEQAHEIVSKASLTDLAMAAELQRAKLTVHAKGVRIVALKEEEYKKDFSIEVDKGNPVALRFIPGKNLSHISRYEEILISLRDMGFCHIQGFSIEDLTKIAEISSLSLREVSKRLVEAGLNLIRLKGGSIWLDRSFKRKGLQGLSPNELIKALHIIHSAGLKSICFLPLRSDDTWEERLLHLSKLRLLEDENPGIGYISIDSSDPLLGGPGALEMRLRAHAISRVFLDNIPLVVESRWNRNCYQEAISLSFGASELHIEDDILSGDSMNEESIVKILSGIGKVGGENDFLFT